MKKTDRKYKIICPECRKSRDVSYFTHRFVARGDAMGRCKPCGMLYREAEKLRIKKEEKAPPTSPIDFLGCRLSGIWVGKRLNSSRCEKFCECANREKCLDAVIKQGWNGFTADGNGFIKRGEFE